MKISTKGRYAVRLLLDIAMNDEVEPVRLKDVAERQDISMKYLEQIISTLVRAHREDIVYQRHRRNIQ